MRSERRRIWIGLLFAVLFTVLAFVSVGCVSGATAPDEEWNVTTDGLISDSSLFLTAELDKIAVLRKGSLNLSGEVSGADVVDIVVLGPRGLRKMPSSITSEIALADGIRFMTAAVAANNTFKAEIGIPEEIYSGFHSVLVITPGEDGVYGSTTRTGG